MKLEVFSRPFFTKYIVHPRSSDLNKHDKRKALISSIAFGILTLGICHAVCAIKYRGRRVSIVERSAESTIETAQTPPKLFLSMDTLTDADQYKIACDLPIDQLPRKLEIFRNLAERNYVRAQFSLGMALLHLGTTDDHKTEGLHYLNQAADAGNVDACKELCLGLSRHKPLTEATKDAIRQRAQAVFAVNHKVLVQVNEVRNVSNLQELEAAFMPTDVWTVERFLGDNLTPLDQMLELAQEIYATPSQRVQMLAVLVAKNYAPAKCVLGKMYYHGTKGCTQNQEAGLEFLKQAADQGDLEACAELCYIYSRKLPLSEETKEEIRKRAQPIFEANKTVALSGSSSNDLSTFVIIHSEEKLNLHLGKNEESSSI